MRSSDPLDKQIDELENKLSLMKLENSKFFENIDILNDEIVVNEEKNKVISSFTQDLKNHVKYLDKKIESLLKEKNHLKSNYNKLISENKK
jgi:hypothetical protein